MGAVSVVRRVLLVAAVWAGTIGAVSPTDPREDKKRVDAELAQAGALLEQASAQAQQAVARLVELNKALPGAQQRAAEARGTAAAAEVAVASSRRAAEAANAKAQEADQRLEAAAERVSEGRKRLGKFVTVAHQGGEIASVNALISAGSPNQLAVRYGYLKRVAKVKKVAVDGLVEALTEAKDVSNQAGMSRREAQAALEAAVAAAAEATRAREAAEQVQREAESLVAQQHEASNRAQQYREEVLAKHEEVKRESERIAQELVEWERRQSQQSTVPAPVLRPGARLLMPVAGWKSSDFGMRYDPYYNVWQLHAGVDIAAAGGEPIYASADGRVASAGWRGGYGNYTCLSHGSYEGQNLSTCYAHQSRILVNQGQWVSRGQLIGRVGTTGASTGNHLHFEVRLDGAPVEPENWLPGCLC